MKFCEGTLYIGHPELMKNPKESSDACGTLDTQLTHTPIDD
jgi:hypothetical protein